MSDRIAVMRGGRVAQMGTADELYNCPADSFVARFLGESNLIAGRVTGLDGRRATLAVEGFAAPIEGHPTRGLRLAGRGLRVDLLEHRSTGRGRTAGRMSPSAYSRRDCGAGDLRCRAASNHGRGSSVGTRLLDDNIEIGWDQQVSILPEGAIGGNAMLTRRHLMAAGAAGAMAGLIGRGRADTIKLTFCSWGGALSDLEDCPFSILSPRREGSMVVPASPTNYAKLKAMVEADRRNGIWSTSAAVYLRRARTCSNCSTCRRS